jgi:hypothetical protein
MFRCDNDKISLQRLLDHSYGPLYFFIRVTSFFVFDCLYASDYLLVVENSVTVMARKPKSFPAANSVTNLLRFLMKSNYLPVTKNKHERMAKDEEGSHSETNRQSGSFERKILIGPVQCLV